MRSCVRFARDCSPAERRPRGRDFTARGLSDLRSRGVCRSLGRRGQRRRCVDIPHVRREMTRLGWFSRSWKTLISLELVCRARSQVLGSARLTRGHAVGAQRRENMRQFVLAMATTRGRTVKTPGAGGSPVFRAVETAGAT